MHPDTLATLYLRTCRWKADDVLFGDPTTRATGRDAREASLRVASGLAALDIAPGDRVALLCKASVRHALTWFGCVLRGAVVCNLHLRETARRSGETIDWLDARVLLTDADSRELAAEIARHTDSQVRVVVLDDAGWERMQVHAPLPETGITVQPDDLGTIQLSSGTTGRPKGVMHTQRTLLENAKAGQIIYGGCGPEDSTLILMQPSFAAWPNVVLPYVGGKARVEFGATFTPGGFLATLAAKRITMAPAVPTMWRAVLAEDARLYDLSALRIATISGELPAATDVERLRRICPVVASVYMSGEAGCGCAVLATNGTLIGRGKADSSGKPVVSADLRIVDADGPIDRELPRGEIGEIVLTGPSLAVGYWKDDALTRERFVDGWWRSGDLGWIDADGDLHLAGRTDNIINTGGIKVAGEEIERALLAHPQVAQAAVVGVPDAQWGQRIVAYVVSRGDDPSPETLDAHCRGASGLPGFKIPKTFSVVRELPTGPTGKLYRRALREEGEGEPR